MFAYNKNVSYSLGRVRHKYKLQDLLHCSCRLDLVFLFKALHMYIIWSSASTSLKRNRRNAAILACDLLTGLWGIGTFAACCSVLCLARRSGRLGIYIWNEKQMTAAETSSHLVLKLNYRFKMFLGWHLKGCALLGPSDLPKVVHSPPTGQREKVTAARRGRSRCWCLWQRYAEQQHAWRWEQCERPAWTVVLGEQPLKDTGCPGSAGPQESPLLCFCSE